MARDWAFVVGVSQYHSCSLLPLKYPDQDAAAIQNVLANQMQFDDVCLFSSSAAHSVLSDGQIFTPEPTYQNLMAFFEERFANPFLTKGDNCWFFFIGHGQHRANEDYLLPQDANLEEFESTAIPMRYVREQLCKAGADIVILVLDACRSENSHFGADISPKAEPGIITFFACEPTEKAWELDEFQQGAFIYTFLETLHRLKEQRCVTAQEFEQQMPDPLAVGPTHERYRSQTPWPGQTPWISANILEKHCFHLISYQILEKDIARLKRAIWSYLNGDIDLAERFCIRANAATAWQDEELLELYALIKQKQKPISTPMPPTDALNSQVGIYYDNLRDLLYSQKWMDADRETDRLIQKLRFNGLEMPCLDLQTIDPLCMKYSCLEMPCLDLQTIDRLWMKYSNGLFGFSVQREVFLSCGGDLNHEHEGSNYSPEWTSFIDRVGWQWKGWDDRLTYDMTAPPGHLPGLLYFIGFITGSTPGDRVPSILFRFHNCTSLNGVGGVTEQ
jgi:hypothetical protein